VLEYIDSVLPDTFSPPSDHRIRNLHHILLASEGPNVHTVVRLTRLPRVAFQKRRRQSVLVFQWAKGLGEAKHPMAKDYCPYQKAVSACRLKALRPVCGSRPDRDCTNYRVPVIAKRPRVLFATSEVYKLPTEGQFPFSIRLCPAS
jgi:hypothetical protein